MSGASLKQRPSLLPHTRLSLPEKASVGLKLSEPISQIQVLQRGNAQRSANPLLVFSMRVWLGQGHRVKRTQRGPGLRSWFIPLLPTVSVWAAAMEGPQGPQAPATYVCPVARGGEWLQSRCGRLTPAAPKGLLWP